MQHAEEVEEERVAAAVVMYARAVMIPSAASVRGLASIAGGGGGGVGPFRLEWFAEEEA